VFGWRDKSEEFERLITRHIVYFSQGKHFAKDLYSDYYTKLSPEDKLVITNEIPKFDCPRCGSTIKTLKCMVPETKLNGETKPNGAA